MTDERVSDKRSSEGDTNLTPRRRQWWDRNLSEEEAELVEADREYFLRQSLSTPVLTGLTRAEGAYIEDVSGDEYLDFHGNGLNHVGFSNPDVLAAIQDRWAEKFPFCTRRYTNEPAVDLAKKLAEITPGNLKKSLFCPGGTDAVEMGLKLARLYTDRHKTISYWDSFHGAGFGAASIGGEELFRSEMGPLLPGAKHVEFPNYYRNQWGFESKERCDRAYLAQLESVFEREPDISAVIAEPIRQGPLIPTQRYWKGVRELCDEHDTLLILDEICDGFGRTGTMFASEQYVTPDILVVGKSLGGGVVPQAGIVVRPELDVAETKAIGHYTHEKSPTTCTAGLETIRYIEEHDLCARSREMGEYALDRLSELEAEHSLVGDVRGRGLLLGVELVRDRETKEKATDEAEAVMYKALDRGLSFKVTMGNILTFAPPLTIARKDLDRAIDVVAKSIAEVEREMTSP